MKLYNTLTREIDELKPLHKPNVTVYTCGPTVYDYPHIGNWFTFIRYDLLIRTIKANALNPTWVMNITDVGHLTSDADEGEDKLAKGAQREGKTAWDIAQFYSQYVIDGLKRLNFDNPSFLPRATDHIKEQIDFISLLEEKGFTYQTSDGVYYDTAKFPTYADFARLDLDEQQAGARVDINPEKHNPSDFALWKFSPKDQQRDMEWDSPWGKGFPGWHIECSAMSLKYLGDTIDIHSGGIDHIPVHHTNEIAQSQAVTGKPLASIWMHTNHILIEDQKISKSLGNGITLEDIEQKGFNLMALRLHVIESHYRSQSKFSWESLEASNNRLLRYKNFAARKYQSTDKGEELTPPKLLTAMNDDLNTPAALAELERFLEKGDSTSLTRKSIEETVNLIDSLFGLNLSSTPDISNSAKELISEREKARNNKDWALSDKLRGQLSDHSIGIMDQPQGPIWYYLS